MMVIQLISNNVWGGGERYVFDLSERLKADDIEVRLVTRGCEVVDKKLSETRLPISHAPLGGIFDRKSRRSILKAVDGIDKEERIIIHAHDFKMAFHAVKSKKMLQKRGWKNVRVVVTRHLVRPGKHDIVNRYVYGGVDAVVFVSECAKKIFLNGNPPIDSAKIRVIGNSLRNVPERILKQSETDVIGVEKMPDVKLLYLGRLSPEKGVNMLLQALAEIKEMPWHLEIVGGGTAEYTEELRKESKGLGISDKISWSGYVSEVWPSIRRADIGVVPTVVPEAFGLSILEFLSQGVPVVATDTGAQGEILTDGADGKLAEPEPSAFAGAIKYLINHPDERERMGANAVETWQRHDYEKFYSQIKGVYDEC